MSLKDLTLLDAISLYNRFHSSLLTTENFQEYIRSLRYLHDFYGNINIKNIKDEDYGKFLSYLKEAGLNVMSQYLITTRIKIFLTFLKTTGILNSKFDSESFLKMNQVKDAYNKHLRDVNPQIVGPMEEELIRFYWLNEGHTKVSLRNYCIINILLETGVKTSKLSNLKKDNFQGFSLSYTNRNGTYESYLSDSTLIGLKAYLNIRKDPSPYLMVSHTLAYEDSKLTDRSIQRIVNQTGKLALSTGNLTPTKLRYTYIVKCFTNGEKSKDIAKKLGYSQTSSLSKFGISSLASNDKSENINKFLDDDMKTINELTVELSVTRSQIYKLLSEKKLKALKIKNQWVVSQDDINKERNR